MIQDDLLFIRAGVDGSTVSVLSVMANSGKDQDRTQLTTAAFTSVCIVMFQTVLTEVFWWTSDSPVSFDLQASLDKLTKLAREAVTKARAAASSASTPIVVLFPEAFLSAYPRGLDFGAKIGDRTAEGRSWFARYHGSSVPICDTEGPEMTVIRNAARENRITLVVGVIERCGAPETGKKRQEYGSSVAG
ncbi:hypothetical protein, partial [Sporisorium scitamineum]